MATNSDQLRFEVEQLETRRLLAGVVSVNVAAGDDIIATGDNASNDIRFYLDSVAGDPYLRVEGNNGTQILFNGVLSAQHTVAYPDSFDGSIYQGDIRIRTRGGDDAVEIVAYSDDGPLLLDGAVDVNLGTGSDSFVITGAAVPDFLEISSMIGGKLKVAGGAGAFADYVDIEGIVAREIDVNLGAAGDQLIDQVFVRDSFAYETMRLVGAGGETEIGVQASAANEKVTLKTGSGEDQVIVSYSLFLGDLDINAGSASSDAAVGDFVQIGSAIVQGDTSIVGGNGQTHVYFDGTHPMFASEFTGHVDVRTGGGDDFVRVTNTEHTVFEGGFSVRTAGGDDWVEIQGETFFAGTAYINLGGGDDLLDFDFNPVTDIINGIPAPPRFVGDLIVRGGAGVDSLHSLNVILSTSEPDITSVELTAA